MAAVWTRFNSLMLVLVFLALVGVLAMLAAGVRGGPLDPPGPVASTDGVRLPGTPIDSIPYTIGASGRYYLTHDLTATSPANGITIEGNDVTLDLNGFTLDGNNVGGTGILAGAGNPNHLTILNGTLHSWTSHGINLEFERVQISNIRVSSNGGDGIRMGGGVLTNCAVVDNVMGVRASDSAISDCTAEDNSTGFSIFDSSLRGCATINNSLVGISASASTVEGCTSSDDNVGMSLLNAAIVRGNTIRNSEFDGLQIPLSTRGVTVVDNVISDSGIGSGFGVGIAVIGSENRISRNHVTHSFGGAGIYVEGSYNTIDENSTHRNGGIGISVVAGQRNTVVRNSADGNLDFQNPTNYFFVAGQNPGPIQQAPVANNPWSNTQTPPP